VRHVLQGLVCCLFIPLFASGQQQEQRQQRVVEWAMPDHVVPPMAQQMRKLVVNLELECKVPVLKAHGATHSAPKTVTRGFRGTGFLVGYKDPRLPQGASFTYLVTNRHVAECWDDNRHPQEVQSIAARINLRDGESISVPMNGHLWRFASDESTDLAVAAIIVGSQAVDYLAIPTDDFFTKDLFKTYNIGEGAKILLGGYFYQLEGEHRVQPIIREGILSMIPDKPLVTTTGKRGSLYLGDVHIFGGNSGSPVFINTQGSVTLEHGAQMFDDYHFLGVVSGYYYEDSEFNLQIATTVNVKQRANSGVSMIIPADLLKELILNDPALKGIRDSSVANLPRQQ